MQTPTPTRAETDLGGSLGCPREGHEDVWALLRRVERPGPPIAEFLGDGDVVGRVHRGGENARERH